MKKEKAFTTQSDLVLAKMKKFCAYRDRCHSEVRSKLLQWEVYGDMLEEILTELIVEGFLNEERFARSYVRGKFRINQWGRNKIRMGLKARDIPASLCTLALTEIDEEEYLATLRDIIRKKAASLSTPLQPADREKLTHFAAGKGFEFELIREVIDEG